MAKVVIMVNKDMDRDKDEIEVKVDILIPHIRKNQMTTIVPRVEIVVEVTNQMPNVIDAKNLDTIKMSVIPRLQMS